MAEQHRQEQQTEQAIKVRQVTDVHANWTAQERASTASSPTNSSTMTGLSEYILRVTADNAKVPRGWFQEADTVYLDLESEVLIFDELT